MRVLIAGVGNVLRADDAFGVEVARRLETMELPPGVRVVETGIAGIALLTEIQQGWDALVVVDAVDHQRPHGTVMRIEPEVIDVHALTWAQRGDMLADMHLATPDRVLMLAKALDVLPPTVLMVGCQIEDPDAVGEQMTPPVAAAVDIAVAEVLHYVTNLVGPAGSVDVASA
ncbi:hydrogenase maturation protease [soil metagenome]